MQLKGTVAAIEAAFHIQMNNYKHPTEDRIFYAPDREPTGLPVPAVAHFRVRESLISYSMFHHRDTSAKPAATTGSGPSASFLGSDMRAAYYGGTALTGSGQTLGLVEYDGYGHRPT